MNRLMIAISAALLLSACGSETEEAKEKAGEMAEDARKMAEDVGNDVKAVAEDVSDAAQDAYDGASAAVQDAYDDASTAVSDAADEAGAAARDAADEVSAAANQAMDDASAAAEDAVDEVNAAAVAAMGAMGVTAAAAMDDGDDCTLGIEVGDNIAYSTDSLSVPTFCTEVTVTITHTGQLPAVAMGHNWVLLPADALDAVAQAGMAAGADAGYVPDDDRIVAATSVVGGGESDSVTFSLDALQDGVTYRYVCTFPGHSAVMQGSFTVSG
jgi:azurin